MSYDTCCCSAPFIGVVENDGMISGVDVDVVEGMRREISRTKKIRCPRRRLCLADEFCG